MSQAVDELLFQLKAAGVPDPELEWVFARPRKWRFDAAWPEKHLALEVDGGAFVGGRHVSGTGFEADAEKMSEAAVRGWRVLRVTPRHIRDGLALRWIERALQQPSYAETPAASCAAVPSAPAPKPGARR